MSNVGFGPDGAHTTTVVDPIMADQGLEELIHPSFVLRDRVADRYSFKQHYGGAGMHLGRRLLAYAKANLRFPCDHFLDTLRS